MKKAEAERLSSILAKKIGNVDGEKFCRLLSRMQVAYYELASHGELSSLPEDLHSIDEAWLDCMLSEVIGKEAEDMTMQERYKISSLRRDVEAFMDARKGFFETYPKVEYTVDDFFRINIWNYDDFVELPESEVKLAVEFWRLQEESCAAYARLCAYAKANKIPLLSLFFKRDMEEFADVWIREYHQKQSK